MPEEKGNDVNTSMLDDMLDQAVDEKPVEPSMLDDMLDQAVDEKPVAPSMLDDMLDQAIDEAPIASSKKVDKKIEISEVISASRWSLPVMDVDPNNVVHYAEDENDPRQKNKRRASDQPQKKLSPLDKLKQTYTEQWREELKKELYEEVYNDAYDDGYQYGFQKGLNEGVKETKNLRQQLQQLIKSLETPINLVGQEVEEQLELLAVTLAQQLVRREIKSNPGEIIGLIRESLKLLPASSRKITISIHPEDAIVFKEALSIDEKDSDLKCTFLEDPMMTRGGCIIKSEQSVINVTLEHRLASLAAAVLSGNRSVDEPQEPQQNNEQKQRDKLSSIEADTEKEAKTIESNND